MAMRFHLHTPNKCGMSPAQTGSQITLYQQLDEHTVIRVSDRLPSFQNNTIFI